MRIFRGVVALFIFVLAGAGTGSVNGQQVPTKTPEEFHAELQGQIAELEAQLAAEPSSAGIWQRLIQLRGMRFTIERNASGAPPTQEEARHFASAQVDEWIAAQPDSSEPHLLRAALLPAEERSSYLLEVEGRFGRDPAFLRRLLGQLAYDGRSAEVERIVADALAATPSATEYEAIHGFLYGADPQAGLDSVIDRWLIDFPGDPAAHAAYLERQRLRGAAPEELSAAAMRAVDLFESSSYQATSGLCRQVIAVSGEDTGLAETCLTKLLAADLSEGDRERALQQVAEFAAGRGDEAEMARVLSEVSDERRDTVVRRLVEAHLSAGRCPEAAAAAAGMGNEGSTSGYVLGRLFAECGSRPELGLQERALALDPMGAQSLLDQWSPRADLEMAIELGEQLLARDASARSVWRAIDRLLEKNGLFERREEHLRRWLSTSGAGAEGVQREDLADLLTSVGRVDEAIDVLQAGLAEAESPFETQLLAALAKTMTRAGRLEEARALVDRMVDSTEDDYWRQRAHYVRAQVEWSSGNGEEAFDALSSYLESTDYLEDEALTAYAMLAEGLEREEEVAGVLERLYDRLHARGSAGGGFEAWAAGRLEAAGLPWLARSYVEAALAANPGDGTLLETLARIDADTGNASAEASLRRSVESDPTDSGRWQRLVEHLIFVDDLDGALVALEEAYGEFGAPPLQLQILEARIYLQRGEKIEAIRLLRPIARTNAYASRAVELLREAYRAVGAEG